MKSIPRGRFKTILFVTRTQGYGGSEKHLIEFLNRLDGGNVRSLVLCADADPYTERLEAGHSTSVSVRSHKQLNSFWKWFSMFRESRQDAVVFIYGNLKAIPAVAPLAARLAGVRRVYSIQHQIPPQPRAKVEGRWFRNLAYRMIGGWDRLSGSLCDATICVCHTIREALVRQYRFPSRKTITIQNGVSLAQYMPDQGERRAITRARLGISSDEILLVCSSRLSPEKGLDLLLLAMSRLVRAGHSCKCVIVGDGFMKSPLLEQVRTLGLDCNVFLEGFHADVRPFLAAADIFVLTSHVEGLPFAILEAMACGLPCVVTDVGGNAEAVTHTVEGLVIPPGSVEEIVTAISFLLTHDSERLRMSRLARARACQNFDIESRMADLKRVILQ